MQSFVIDENQAGQRLDFFIAQQLPQYSRSSWKKLIEQGFVLVNGEQVNGKLKLKDGDKIKVKDYEEPENPDLEVIYQDDDVIVINKPSGLLTHLKSKIASEPTVASFITDKTTATGESRAGIVHRLDRATSGVILAAKNEKARVYMVKQFANRRVKKWYLAVVKGSVTEDYYEIDKPIARSYRNPSQFRINPNGKSAKTEVFVLDRSAARSVVLLKPYTGRTHQLRVHLLSIGHPIVGDPIYYPKHKIEKNPQLLLHAWRLEATLPSNNHLEFVADIPEHMSEYISDDCRDKAANIVASH